MVSDVPTFTVGSAPHWRSRSSITQMNLMFIAALLPTALVGAVVHAFGENASALAAAPGVLGPAVEGFVEALGAGPGIVWIIGIAGILAFGMGFGILVEYFCQILMRQPYHATNGHGALMGLLIAMLMPPSVPLWVLFAGVVVAIFLGKQVFGGIGGYPMHPAIVGWLVLLLSWPNHLYPVGTDSIAASHWSSVAATAAGGIFLLLFGQIRWQIPVGVLAGVIGFSFLFQADLQGGLVDQLITGHVLLAAFFLATDATSSPANRTAMLLFGFGTGFLIVLIRAYGIWPDSGPFAVLLMNIMSPLLDRIKPKIKGMVNAGSKVNQNG